VNTYSVTPSVNNPYCIHDNSTRFTAPTPYNTPGIRGKWTGVGIVNDTLGIWDLKKSGIGTHWVKYAVTGNACANEDSTQVEIFGNPDVSILSPDSLCLIYNDTARHKLIPKEPGGWFSGLGVDSVINSSGGTTYYFDAQLFKQQSSRTDSAHITYARTKGCHADTTIAIPLVKPWDHTFLGVLEIGLPYPTTSFCQSDSMPDTLAVVGKNPVWFIQTDSTAMIDQNRGILDPTVVGAGKTSDVLRRITVGNYGFCGTDTTFTALFVKAPEIEVLGRIYCPDYINDPANRTKVDTVLFRIPKGPTLAGATGKKTLDPNGFDSTSEVNAYYGDVALTGWPQSYGGGVPNQFLYNYWDGKPWMTFPNVARYRLSNLKQGKNRIIYQYAFKYRDNHPTQFACISRDTAYIEKSDCVGIEEFDANQLQIYPNPAQDKVYLIWTNYSGHNIDVKLFDIRGKMVFENSLSQHEITQGVEFDISSIPPGSYFINLSSDKTSKKVKLIIQ
jgi:hypothetical protein